MGTGNAFPAGPVCSAQLAGPRPGAVSSCSGAARSSRRRFSGRAKPSRRPGLAARGRRHELAAWHSRGCAPSEDPAGGTPSPCCRARRDGAGPERSGLGTAARPAAVAAAAVPAAAIAAAPRRVPGRDPAQPESALLQPGRGGSHLGHRHLRGTGAKWHAAPARTLLQVGGGTHRAWQRPHYTGKAPRGCRGLGGMAGFLSEVSRDLQVQGRGLPPWAFRKGPPELCAMSPEGSWPPHHPAVTGNLGKALKNQMWASRGESRQQRTVMVEPERGQAFCTLFQLCQALRTPRRLCALLGGVGSYSMSSFKS